MRRQGVRTRTLGVAWEERFLAAVRKAREQKLIGAPEADRLRRIAGAYDCVKCRQEHRTESALGKKHLRLQPPPPATPGEVPKKGKPLPVKLAALAKAAGRPARAKLTRKDGGPEPARMPRRAAKR
ncbi:MAG: hypothetical protein LC624_07460 [Halobacteriales archaeon]|nr:hypothetical protein [Halobacteriales archaeon]